MTAARAGAKCVGARLAVEVEADLELAIFEAKDAVVPVAGFGTFDEFDIDPVRLGFNVNVENAFVDGLEGLGTESISVDEQAR